MRTLSFIMTILCIPMAVLCLPAFILKDADLHPKCRIPGRMAVICTVINALIVFNADFDDATWKSTVGIFILLTFGLVVLGFILYLAALRFKLPVTDETKESLYNKCKEIGVTDLKTEADRRKAQIVAKKMNFPEDAIEEAFEYGKRADSREETMKAMQELQKKKGKDYQIKEDLERFVSYSGIAKRRAMLEYRLKKCREDLKENEKRMMRLSSLGKGADPYIVGGLVSGIAGAGAGLYAAMETSRQNAQNEKDVELLKVMGSLETYDVRSRRQKEEKQIMDALADLNNKLVSEHTREECFSKLHFSDSKVSLTEAGSCIVDADVIMDSFTAIEGMSTVIDGSVLGKIFSNDRQIGTATLVFGEMGVSSNAKRHISGIALFCGKQGEDYRVEFAPNKLWAMER